MNKILFLCLISLAISSYDLERFREEVLKRHNTLRAKHQVDKLTRYSKLESLAQKHSEYMAQISRMQSSNNKLDDEYIGENICSGSPYSKIGKTCVDLWYSEEKDYDYINPSYDGKAYHFTQIVWKKTNQLGCGIQCDSKSYCYMTCYYYPAGNYYNQFKKNVFPKLNENEEDEKEEEEDEVPQPDEEDDTPDSSQVKDKKLEQFREEALARHNFFRAHHNAKALVRSAKLERIAQEAAEYMVKINNFHFPDEKYNDENIGMNLFWQYGPFDGISITDYWYDQRSKYDFNKPGYVENAGGFTQLVWKSTKKMGCGYSCKGLECYGLCTYYPAGNYHGMFDKNVFPQTS